MIQTFQCLRKRDCSGAGLHRRTWGWRWDLPEECLYRFVLGALQEAIEPKVLMRPRNVLAAVADVCRLRPRRRNGARGRLLDVLGLLAAAESEDSSRPAKRPCRAAAVSFRCLCLPARQY